MGNATNSSAYFFIFSLVNYFSTYVCSTCDFTLNINFLMCMYVNFIFIAFRTFTNFYNVISASNYYFPQCYGTPCFLSLYMTLVVACPYNFYFTQMHYICCCCISSCCIFWWQDNYKSRLRQQTGKRTGREKDWRQGMVRWGTVA